VELDTASQPELEELERLAGVELVVGILDVGTGDAENPAAMVRQGLAGLSKTPRAVVISNNGAHSPATATPAVPDADQPPAVLSITLPAPGPADTLQQTRSRAYQRVIAVSGKLGVRACGVIASQPHAATPQWIHRIVQPVIDLGFDLVAPRYTRHKMEGMLNRSVLAPLHRALYGEQLQNPMGPDFGLSGKLLLQVLRETSAPRQREQNDLLAAIASTASRAGFQVCESHLGVLTQHPTDWTNLSSLLAEVLAPVFLELERQAAFWQSVRGSKPVPKLGSPEAVSDDAATPDVRRMIESFQLGIQNLQDVWRLVLPPATLFELVKLSRLPQEKFRMPDEVWVRIVYDFALAHRLRTINRDHLLRSITPLYLGWIASYALEMERASAVEVDARIETLARAYEANKSYLVSRWRWPDRFNP
jgi:hypothetical protein